MASYYAIIPANVRYDKNITPNAKLLYGEITALCNEKGYCWAGNEYFANLYGVSKVSVSKWIKSLVDGGYIESTLVHKEGSKEIDKRVITLAVGGIKEKLNTPIKEKLNTSQTKVNEGIKEKLNTPIKEKFKDNNTSFNNTVNNTINKRLLADEKKFNNVNEIIEHYKCLPNLPNFRTVTDKRKGNIKYRLSEFSLEEIKETLSKINETKFFIDNKEKSWFTFDWIFNPNNFVKIIEGKYWDDKNNNYNVNKGEKVLTAEEQALKDLLNF